MAVWPEKTLRQTLDVAAGTTLHDLRHDTRLDSELQRAWEAASGVGVFGQRKPVRAPLADGDRIELWRGLVADPKDARRQRARAAAKARKQAVKPPGK